MLMRAGAEPARGRDLSHLRFLASVGEALPPDAVLWGQEVLGRPFHDNWWQTETGGIAIANYAATEVRPGSMGRPLPGIDAGVVRRTVAPEEVGLPRADTRALAGGQPAQNAALIVAILQGREQGPPRDVVALNAGAALVAAGRADDIREGVQHALSLIASGAAHDRLERLRLRSTAPEGAA